MNTKEASFSIMEKIFKNKSVILGLAMLFVFGVGLLTPNVGLAVSCVAGSTTCEDIGGMKCVDGQCVNEAPKDVNGDGKTGGLGLISSFADEAIGGVLAYLGNLILQFLSFFVYLAANIFELSAKWSLNGFYADGAKMPVILSAWRVCRDLANVFFVFILLYISLGTILQLSGRTMKEMLGKVLITAILLNFSFTITGIIIDVSNVIAVEFYNKTGGAGDGPSDGVTGKVMNGLKMTTLFEAAKKGDLAESEGKGSKMVQVIYATIFGSIIMIVLICVLLIAAFLFLSRMVAFMFLIMLSPLAFAISALPKGSAGASKYSEKWWTKLTENAVFAPIFMFLFYLVVAIIDSGAILTAMNIKEDANTSFGALISGAATGQVLADGTVLLVLNYILIIGLLIGTITVAKNSGVAGAGFATGQFDKLRGYAQGKAKDAAKWTAGKAADTRVGRGATAVASRIPLVGGGIASARLARDAAKEKAAGDKFKGLTRGQLLTRAQPSNFNRMSSTDKHELLTRMSKYPGTLNGMNKGDVAQAVKDIKRQGGDVSAIIGADPRLLNDKEIMATLGPSDIANLPEKAVTPEFVSNFLANNASPEHLQMAMGNPAMKEGLKAEIRKLGGITGSDTTPGNGNRIGIANKLEATNPTLANWVRNNTQAMDLLGISKGLGEA